MSTTLKTLTALPLIALLAACQAGGGVETEAGLEATLDQDIDGDGTIPGPTGAELQVSD
ncbi:hypothetical protein [Jannaschia ovalis]|uniref:Uncharacterized protein n=1 Tax=Jannaschia ovalis TaxID=3038773 RepID=A0ABY8LI65_9RHOB|nr:hypothetical protein [Jannaschia sp. GRR-S6-38]WGH80070.1 hypothetical protein P8627_07350 [Jannaschia sp. GRR-S6-38]